MTEAIDEQLREQSMDQFHKWEHYGEAEHFAFVDFLLATPDVTPEQIFERTGIAVPHDEVDAVYYFCKDVIDDAADSDTGSEFGFAIQCGDVLAPAGENWTVMELRDLYYTLHGILFRSSLESMAESAQHDLPQFAEPQPA
jgi:hypothetical protein